MNTYAIEDQYIFHYWISPIKAKNRKEAMEIAKKLIEILDWEGTFTLLKKNKHPFYDDYNPLKMKPYKRVKK